MDRATTIYENVHSVDTWTNPAHAALFTGRYPTYAGSRHFTDVGMQGRTLAEKFGAQGYFTIADTDGGQLSPVFGFDRGFDIYRSRYEPVQLKFQRALKDIRLLKDSNQPFFLFLHTYAVHEPYSISQSTSRNLDWQSSQLSRFPVRSNHLPSLSRKLGIHPLRSQAASFLRAQYDLGARAFLDNLSRFLSDLEGLGVMDRDLVIVLSDHGEEFDEHGRFGHGSQFPYAELTHIPVIEWNGDKTPPIRVSQFISQVEIPGIVLDHLEIDHDFHDECSMPGVVASIVTTKYCVDYPVQDFFSVSVNTLECQYREIVDRVTGNTEVSDFLRGDNSTCSTVMPQIRKVVDCLRSRMIQGGNGEHPSSQLDDSQELDSRQQKQLEALGYVER